MNGKTPPPNAVTANELDWALACAAAAEEADQFLVFRKSPTFLRVVEGSPRVAGYWNLKRLLDNEIFVRALPLLQLSDAVGLPSDLISFDAAGESFNLSATTIRYANNAINVLDLFGLEVFRGGIIHEVGGGYGGEATVFNHFSKSLLNLDLADRWFIYDLPSSYALINKFCHEFGYRVTIKNDMEAVGHIDLVISNGALSEMWGDTLDNYIRNVVAPARCGYFMTNFESHSLPNGGISTTQFVQKLRDLGKDDVQILSTKNYLSKFDVEAGTVLIVFGAANHRTPLTKRSLWSAIILKLLTITDRFQNRILEHYLGR
jgi:hypothetical protein